MPTASKEQEVLRLHAIVKGHVQGVNFRSYTQREALRLGLGGWVRNLNDGTVETVAEGQKANIRAFLKFLHVGPPSARVNAVEASWQEPTHDFDGFRVRYR